MNLCPSCGKGFTRDSITCPECMNKRYYNFKKSGICVYCKRQPVVPGKTKCQECINKVTQNRKAYTPSDDAKQKQNYYALIQKRREQNLCIYCGKTKPVEGKTGCRSCLDKKVLSAQRYVIRNMEQHCQRVKIRSKVKYYQCVQDGICPRCKVNKPESGKKICRECITKITQKKLLRGI